MPGATTGSLSSCTERSTSATAEAASALAEGRMAPLSSAAAGLFCGAGRLPLELHAESHTSQELAQHKRQIVCAARMMLR